MKPLLTIAFLAGALFLGACSSNPFASVGVGATYTDPSTGATYGGDVNATFKDSDGKTVKKPKSSAQNGTHPAPRLETGRETSTLAANRRVASTPQPVAVKMPFREALGRGLLRLVDTPQPGERPQGPHLEEIAYGNTYIPAK